MKRYNERRLAYNGTPIHTQNEKEENGDEIDFIPHRLIQMQHVLYGRTLIQLFEKAENIASNQTLDIFMTQK